MPAALDAGTVLAALADPARPLLSWRCVVVVAHPDDEVIGLGAQLPRLSDVRIVHVTDGAPRSGGDARKAGFSRPEDYAAARRRELEAAMALTGKTPADLAELGIPDQQVASSLDDVTQALVPLIDGAHIVFTHAYEGGHPDHDATAYAVHRAAGRLPSPPVLVEMPFYRGGPAGPVWQDFAPRDGRNSVEVPLGPAEQDLKRRMLAAFVSQAQTLAPARVESERFRAAEGEDFTVLPNGGDVLYERYGWGFLGNDLLEAFAAFDAEREGER